MMDPSRLEMMNLMASGGSHDDINQIKFKA